MIISVNARLSSPFGEDGDGNLIALDNPIVPITFVSPSQCEHDETICVDCAGAWAQDWTVESVTLADDEGMTTVPFEWNGLS